MFFDQLLKQIFWNSGAYLINRGGLFGLPSDPRLSLLVVLLFLLALFLRTRALRPAARFSLPLALLLGGIAGNLADRLLRGFVIDYLELGGVCAFNLADLAIAGGAALFVWRIMKE